MLTIREADPPAASFTRRPRDRSVGIHQFQIHSTQGPTTLDKQVSATMNWFGNPKPFPQGNDKGGWGGSADFVVGPHLGNLRVYKFGDWFNTYSSWSAGFGLDGTGRTEYGAAEVGIAIEVAQEALPGKALGNYDLELVDLVASLMSYCNSVLQAQGRPPIPNNRVSYWSQERSAGIPRGIIGHEDLANGRRLGKHDPGPNFPWTYLQHRFQVYEDIRNGKPEPGLPPPTTPQLDMVPVPRQELRAFRDWANLKLGET